MKDTEFQAIFNYSQSHDRAELSVPMADNPSEDYEVFISEVIAGRRESNSSIKDSVRYQRRVALLVHLVGRPKKTIEYADSEFNLIAPLVNRSPTTVRKYYYGHKKYIEDIYLAVEQFRNDPESVQKEAWPPLRRYLDEADSALNIINSRDK